MLSLFLDEHISPFVCAFFRKQSDVPITATPLFEDGRLLGASDEVLLSTLAPLGLTLVTYDVSSIPELLMVFHEQERSHGGVIFVSSKTIPCSNSNALARFLAQFASREARTDWTDRVVFLNV